jgi:hypothetical protein
MVNEPEPSRHSSDAPAERIVDHRNRRLDAVSTSTKWPRTRYAADLLFCASEEELNAIARLPEPAGIGQPFALWDRDWIERHLRCAQICLQEAQLTSFSPSTRAGAAIDAAVHCALAAAGVEGVMLPVGLFAVALVWLSRLPALSETAQDGACWLVDRHYKRMTLKSWEPTTEAHAATALTHAHGIYEETSGWIRTLSTNSATPSGPPG